MKRNFYNPYDLILSQVYTNRFIQSGHLGYTHKGGLRKKRQLLSRILVTGLYYIQLRIVAEGSYYHSPFAGKYFFVLYMGRKSEKEVAHILLRRPQMYRTLDLLASGGQINQVKMYIPALPSGQRTRHVQLPGHLWQMVCTRISQNKPYTCMEHIFSAGEKITHKQVTEYLCSCFPTLPIAGIQRAFSYGLYRICKYLQRRINVSLKWKRLTFRAFRFQPLTRQKITRHVCQLKLAQTPQGASHLSACKARLTKLRQS